MAAPTIYEDIGQVKLRMALKDGGNAMAVTAPTAVNAVTVTRYHVDFKRSDGRNTPGVGRARTASTARPTGTIGADGGVLTFVLVRAQAKLEAPLKALRNGGGAIIDLDHRRGHLLRDGPERQHGLGDRHPSR